MTKAQNVRGLLNDMLEATRSEELDCTSFLELLAPFLDGDALDEPTRELIARHRDLCADCAEELAILERVLGAD